MANHFQTCLAELSAAFTRDKRHDGATFYKLRDEGQRWCSRSWLTSDTMRDVHEAVDGPSPRLPDDWIYEQASAVASALNERTRYHSIASADDARDATSEIADSLVDVYNADRLRWLASHLANSSLVDEACNELGIGADVDTLARIGAGQQMAIERIASALIEACEAEANDRGDDSAAIAHDALNRDASDYPHGDES